MNKNKQLGRQGELLARRYLERLGYKIIATNFATRTGEIDIVCRDRVTLVFVEVKTRHSSSALPESAVNQRKLLHLGLAIAEYCDATQATGPLRLDVVSININRDGQAQLHHFQDILNIDYGD